MVLFSSSEPGKALKVSAGEMSKVGVMWVREVYWVIEFMGSSG